MTEPGGRAGPGLEHTIAQVLTLGTRISVVLVGLGVLLMFVTAVSPLSGGPALDLGHLASDLAAFRPEGFLWLGLIAVLVTPVARVAASLVGYARGGEPRMAFVAALILVVIATSVILAQAPAA
jgi:uncharacterized membrane protein